VKTGSGAGTLVGENMQMNEDPFSGRLNKFKSQSFAAGKRINNRNSCNLYALDDKNDTMHDSSSLRDSIVSGNFGGIKPIRTPGFSQSKTFAFGED